MALPTKQYGLILPQKKGASKGLQKPSVFGDDSDEETSVGESLQREAIKKKMMKQTRLEMQKALEEDSTVYDYDSVYDDIQQQRLDNNKKILSSADKRPKYIHQLMKAVEDRNKEQLRREERKIQKEREAEGEQFADKDAYVTSAYRQRLLEQKEEQEREKREAALEAALDVKKQQDLSGFYRHLLNQTVGEEAIPDNTSKKTQTSKMTKDTERTSPVPSPSSRENVQSSCSDSEEGQEPKCGFIKPGGGGSAHSKRQYRQRSPSSDSEEEKERERERERHKRSHRDQNRDRGRDRDRDRDRDRERDRNRGREREDKHRSDRDRRKDRDRERDRDRGRERDDRHGKRDRSPGERDRERDRNGDRDKRRTSDEDRRKDKHAVDERERRKEAEKEKAAKREEKGPEQKESAAAAAAEEDGQTKGAPEKEETADAASKFAKRSTDQTVTSARERFMARQMARSATKSYVEKEED